MIDKTTRLYKRGKTARKMDCNKPLNQVCFFSKKKTKTILNIRKSRICFEASKWKKKKKTKL